MYGFVQPCRYNTGLWRTNWRTRNYSVASRACAGVKRVKLDVTQRATRMRVYKLMSRVLVISGLLSYVDRQLQLSLLAHPVMHTANTVLQASTSLAHSLTHSHTRVGLLLYVHSCRRFDRSSGSFFSELLLNAHLRWAVLFTTSTSTIAACSIQHIQTSENLAVPFSHRCFLPRSPIPRGQEGSSVIGLL